MSPTSTPARDTRTRVTARTGVSAPLTPARAALARPELGPGLVFIALLGILSLDDGGFPATVWYPAAIFMLALFGLVAWFFRDRFRLLSRTTWIAIGLLGALAIWSFASIAWAGVPGIAWDGSNRIVLYLIAFATFALLPWRGSSAAIVLGAYSVVIAVIGIAVVAGAAGDGNAVGAVIDGRFADPVGYPNGTAGLFAMAFWPALLLASRREVPWAGRALMLATAGVLLQLAILPQSRGAFLSFPIALVIFFALTPRRLGVVAVLVPIALVTAVASDAILDVYSVAGAGGAVGPEISDALRAIVASFAALLAIGTCIAVADRDVELGAERERHLARGARQVGIALAALAVIAALIAIGNPVSWTGDRWDEFKSGYGSTDFSDSRLTGGLGSNRYDFWRVAVSEEFADSPLAGQGSDNFAVGYLEHRRSEEEPLYPHSLPIRMLAGLGIVGFALFLGAAIAAIAAAVWARRRAPEPLARAIVAAALGSAAYFALHSGGDWIWSFPAIALPCVAWLGMASGFAAGEPAGERPREAEVAHDDDWRGMLASIGAGLAIGLAIFLVGLSFALPWLSARETAIAASSWEDDPQAAFDRLERARDLNLLSAQPDLTAGAIASRLGDEEKMRAAFSLALARERDNWYATLELGVLEALDGDRAGSVRRLERARELNPRDPLIREALRGARSGEPISVERVQRTLLARVCAVVGPTEDTRYCK